MYTLNMFSKGMHVYSNKFETVEQAEQMAERFFIGCGIQLLILMLLMY